MNSIRSESEATPKSAKKDRRGSNLKSRSYKRKPVAGVRPHLKAASADFDLTLGFQHYYPVNEMINNTYWNTTPAIHYREPYQPQCEPITPEPQAENLQSHNNDRLFAYQILSSHLHEKMIEDLDALVILSEEYRNRRVHTIPWNERNYLS